MTAFADDEIARPEELFLGDHAWLQERAELQLSARPAWSSDRWDMGAAVEYGLTRRIQLQLEGEWIDGPNMDALSEVELGAQFGVWRKGGLAIAVGANGTAEIVDSEVELGFEPQASVSFATDKVGVNLAASVAVAEEMEATVSLALFARFGMLYPIVEGGVADGEALFRGGLAVEIGSAELGAAVGYSKDLGTSVHAALTWEIELGGGDDDDHGGGEHHDDDD